MLRFDTSPRVAFSCSSAQHLADNNNEEDDMNKRFFKPLSSLITISAVVLLLTACGGGGDGGGSSSTNTSTSNPAPVTFTGGTNRGILNGVALGSGTKLTEDTVKTVSVTTSFLGYFSVGPAYLSRSGFSFHWIIPITNYGPPRCGIQLLSISFKDSSGALLFSEDQFVAG